MLSKKIQEQIDELIQLRDIAIRAEICKEVFSEINGSAKDWQEQIDNTEGLCQTLSYQYASSIYKK